MLVLKARTLKVSEIPVKYHGIFNVMLPRPTKRLRCLWLKDFIERNKLNSFFLFALKIST